ncbi:MAG: signal peptidase II, partial [Stenotrophobium sp.]
MAFQKKNVYWLWLSLFVIFVDQVSKQVIVKYLDWFDTRPLVPHLNLVHMKNTGAAFSMFNTAPAWTFAVLGVAVSVGILVWMRRHPQGETLVAVALSLILGGALGNVIDRAARGYVVDFIDFYVGRWHFAAFNIADSAITLGAGLLLLDMFMQSRRGHSSP